ncbi:MAG: bifunctional methylenetetrahydrofolate dehydrogenase/methenyltetrahydrofolate cyclohydrolase FolD [Calditrichia bacterium]|nr:bifunctional methylenetetrahydrofolate dehydrogenase/methenyltetrahydrofolate cyclohydrolase FolD [Calditrichia bacterium]
MNQEDKLIDGKIVSNQVKEEVREETEKLIARGIKPGLIVVLVGEDPASAVYVRNKSKACEKAGIVSETIKLPEDTSEEDLLNLIEQLNKDPQYHGILVQLPLPDHINETKVIELINPLKDVDCFHPVNVGKLVSGQPYVLPCTPAGILRLLQANDISTEGKHVVIIGRSNIVGKPLANLLIQKSPQANSTVTVVHSRTKNIAHYTRQADILIAAMGTANFVTEDMIKENVVIIDVGINRVSADNEKGYILAGDVDFNNVLPKVSKITPVPGGVGPMTIAMLLKNTLAAAEYQESK